MPHAEAAWWTRQTWSMLSENLWSSDGEQTCWSNTKRLKVPWGQGRCLSLTAELLKSTSVESWSIFARWKWNEWMHLGQFLFIFNILIHLKLAQATSEISLFSSFQQIVGIKRTVNYSPVLVQLSLLDWLKTSSLWAIVAPFVCHFPIGPVEERQLLSGSRFIYSQEYLFNIPFEYLHLKL